MPKFKKLKGVSGNLLDPAAMQEDTPTSIIRKAILVHSGPNGKAITFESSDGPISFDAARIKNIVKNQNAMIEKMVAEYGGWEKTPKGAFPPILDQHSDDSNDRIRGRLSAPLEYEVRDVPKVGKNVSCAVTYINYIGKDTVEQVNDGRIYHLSVGISEETDTLGETSTVIDPAAPGAMNLNKGKKMAKKKLKTAQKTKKPVKNLAAGKRNILLKQLSEGMGNLAKMIKTTNTNLSLAKREGAVGTKLKKLMASKKLTPAEYKKLDVKKLSKLDEESFNTVMSTYEAREDVIMAGQRGSKDSKGVGDMAKEIEKKQLKRLKSEIRGDFKKLGKKMKEESEEDSEMSAEDDGKKKDMAFGDEDQGDKKKEKKDMADVGEEENDLSLADHEDQDDDAFNKLQSQVDELNTNMARMAGMVGQLMECEKEEGEEAEMSEGEDDEEELASGEEGDEDADDKDDKDEK